MKEIVTATEKKMEQALNHFKEELKQIRTGRANPAMLDSISVEVFGSPMKLKALASITCPEQRTLQVTPFDPKNAGQIAKGIEKANLGFQTSLNGPHVLIRIPQMDSNVRNQMVKLLNQLLEACRVSIRNIRRDGNEALKKGKSDGDLPEDQQKKGEKKYKT